MNTTTYFVLNWNVLALLSFYSLPSGGNQKTRWSIAAPEEIDEVESIDVLIELRDVHLGVAKWAAVDPGGLFYKLTKLHLTFKSLF